MRLDKRDFQLLAELDANARQTYLQLGRKLRLSKDAVKYRMERLEREGIIEGYYAEINSSALGYTIYRFYLKLQNTDTKTKNELIEWLKSRPETFVLAEIIGTWDIAIIVWAKDILSLEQFWNEFKKKHRQHIQHYLLSIFTNLHSFSRKYLGASPSVKYITHGTLSKIDSTDKSILRLLAENGRITFVQLSRLLRLSPKVIAYRVRALQKSIILRYRVKLNYVLLQRGYYKVDINLNDTSFIKSLHQFALQHPDIIYINQTLGSADFEFDAELTSFNSLLNLIQLIQKISPGIVRDYTYFQILKVHKIKYYFEK